jgi:hypothetical protein
MTGQRAADSTNILRLASELGHCRAWARVYDEYSVGSRVPKSTRDKNESERDGMDKLSWDLEAAILLSRAECLDDAVCQAAVAFQTAEILSAIEYVDPSGLHYARQLRAATASMASILIRDHGQAYLDRVGPSYCPASVLLGSNSRAGITVEETKGLFVPQENRRVDHG